MNTATINLRINPTVKKEAQKVANELGMNLSVLINGFLKNLVKTKSIVLSTSEKPSPYLIRALKESEKDIREGWVSPAFDNAEDAIAWLNDPKAKYVRQLRPKV